MVSFVGWQTGFATGLRVTGSAQYEIVVLNM